MKRKNKQIINFSVVGIFALALGGSISFMAFGNQGGNRTNIAFIGNNGQNWNDGGFNTNSHNAVTEYADNSDAKFKTDTYGAYSNDGSTYVSPTLKAFNQGDDIAVSSGFNFTGTILGYDVYEDQNTPPTPDNPWDDEVVGHVEGVYGDPIPGSNYSSNYGDKQVVLADDNQLAATYTNAVSINYMSQGAGFLAGLAAAMYSTAWQLTIPADENNYTNVVTCYGGLDMNVNYDYMSGFEQGVNYWNYAALGYTTKSHEGSTSQNVNIPVTTKKVENSNNIAEGEIKNILGNDGSSIKPIEVAVPTSNKKEYYYASDHYKKEFYPIETSDGKEYVSGTDTTNWYIGGFPTMETDDPGEAAINIAKWGAKDNIATIFPIAGASTMYTYRKLASKEVHDKEKITQVIGVDSDATLGDSESDEYILGSATKNLEMGIQYGIWAADYKQGDTYVAKDMNGNAAPIDPSGNIKDSTDFMKPLTPINEFKLDENGDKILDENEKPIPETPGWNYSADVNTDDDLTNDIPGQQFTGTIDNGGSYFTPGVQTNGRVLDDGTEVPGYELQDSLTTIEEEFLNDDSNLDKVTLQSIADVSLAQNPLIEYRSHTFSLDYQDGLQHVTVDQAAIEQVYNEIKIDMSPWMVGYNLEDKIE